MTKEALKEYYENDIYPYLDEVQKEQENILRKKTRLKMVLFGLFLLYVIPLWGTIFDDGLVILLFLPLIIFVPFSFLGKMIMEGDFRKTYKSKVIEPLMLALGENIYYESLKGISRDDVNHANMFETFNTYNCDDYIKGDFSGVTLEFSEAHVHYEVSSRSYKSVKKILDGFIFKVDLEIDQIKGFCIVPDKAQKILGDKLGGLLQKVNLKRDGVIHLEDASFEKVFAVYSDDKESVRRFLSIEICQYLVFMKEKLDVNIYMAIRDTKLYIALDVGKETFFEPNYYVPLREHTEPMDLIERIDEVTTLIKMLKLEAKKS